jgi:hypothetical protein
MNIDRLMVKNTGKNGKKEAPLKEHAFNCIWKHFNAGRSYYIIYFSHREIPR